MRSTLTTNPESVRDMRHSVSDIAGSETDYRGAQKNLPKGFFVGADARRNICRADGQIGGWVVHVTPHSSRPASPAVPANFSAMAVPTRRVSRSVLFVHGADELNHGRNQSRPSLLSLTTRVGDIRALAVSFAASAFGWRRFLEGWAG